MSNYLGKAINPNTGKVEDVEFLDGYFVKHRYGVRFPDGSVYKLDAVEVPLKQNLEEDLF